VPLSGPVREAVNLTWQFSIVQKSTEAVLLRLAPQLKKTSPIWRVKIVALVPRKSASRSNVTLLPARHGPRDASHSVVLRLSTVPQGADRGAEQ